MSISELLSQELSQPISYVENVIALIDEGNTIPFIARYRKEMHGAMDDQVLRTLADRLTYLRNLDTRRSEVKNTIETQGKLTEELALAIDNAKTLAEVEDLYRPYKQKRRTRATMAREKGLGPLAERIFAQDKQDPAPEIMAEEYVTEELTLEDVLAGANDIIAELVSDNADVRKMLRTLMLQRGVITSLATDPEKDSVYRNYYEFRSPVAKLQSHQTLALNRGEREEFLKIGVEIDHDTTVQAVCRQVMIPGSQSMAFLRAAVLDAYDRLIAPSMEREIRNTLTDSASEAAIGNFALNLKPLLLQPPVKGNVTMGLDPGYRNGCKVAVIDGFGNVLDTTVVYPTFSKAKEEESITKLDTLIRKHKVTHIAIGNGTASRETEQMTAKLVSPFGGAVSYMIVNEAGASVYSASPLAAEEFPQFDVNLRSAVSIARRLQDPLAELVKIDPKAIGVGQYQHDMPEKRLDEALGAVVEDCVNSVGVDLNTASMPLLKQVAGITATTAKNIITYRQENGAFTTRKQLLKVPKLGPKAFTQCAGFLRVPESKLILDNTGVHPESYDNAKALLAHFGLKVDDIGSEKMTDFMTKVNQEGLESISENCGVGVPTLVDILKELQKPGRDPRAELPPPVLRTDVLEMKDLKADMELTGTVRNVIDFGVFVDIGVHQDGLVHISQVTNRFIKHPSEVVSVGDVVKVKVLDVDEKKKRISLTMKF